MPSEPDTTRFGTRPCLVALLVIPLAVGATACSPVSVDSTVSANATATRQTGQFSGPYAAEFYRAWERSPDGFIRDALADGVITEQEESESWSRYTDCLGEVGITVTSREFDGSYTTKSTSTLSGQQQQDVANACSVKSGEADVSSLYSWISRNPMNLDENTIVAACLVEKELAPRGYDAKDYERDQTTGETSEPEFIDTEAEYTVYRKCLADPLGLEQK